MNRLLQLLGSYDFFGKAVPGAAFLFGMWLLLPENVLPISSGDGDTTLFNLLALIIAFFILGLMIGQGVHTFADNIEKVFRWLLLRTVDFTQVLQLYDVELGFDRFRPSYSTDRVSSFRRFVYDWHEGTVEWVRDRFWGAFDSFVDHRFLFAMWFEWNYARAEMRMFTGRWEPEEKEHLMEPFAETYEDIFGENIRQIKGEKLDQAYVLVTSHLSQQGSRGHRQFQSIYSFCRSMWVILFTLTILYALAIYQPFGNLGLIADQPRLNVIFPAQIILYVPLFIFLSGVLFLDASGTYKRHFIEYLLASFANIQTSEEPDMEQKSLDQF